MPKRIPPLSESRIATAEAKDKDYKLSDGGGLYLLVTSTGSKLWRFHYRFSEKQKLLALGAYPEVSLANAREKRDEAKNQLARGLDPSELKKKQKNADGSSFETVAREWHARFKSQWSDDHAEHILSRLQYDVFPFIGHVAISEIEASDLLAVLRRIEVRTFSTAKRIRTAFRQIFRYALQTGRAEHDPTENMRGARPPTKDTPLAPHTGSIAIATLLLAIDGYNGAFVVKSAMQLAPLLLVDPVDLCHAEWEEIDFQGELWNMPTESTDLAQAHIVPLARQAIEILRRLSSLTGHCRYLFPSFRSSLRCVSFNAVSAALGGMGFGNDEIDGKRFWQVARVALTEGAKVSTDIIDLQLSRRTKAPMDTAYDPMQFLPQRREMMQNWADYLDDLKKGGVTLPERIKVFSPDESFHP